jgi:hypothetical protein
MSTSERTHYERWGQGPLYTPSSLLHGCFSIDKAVPRAP